MNVYEISGQNASGIHCPSVYVVASGYADAASKAEAWIAGKRAKAHPGLPPDLGVTGIVTVTNIKLIGECVHGSEGVAL